MLPLSRFHWSIGFALAITVGLAVLIPFVLSGIEVFHSKVDGGGLAASLDAEETLVFLRTASPKVAQGFLTALKTDRAIPELVEGNHYEMALQNQSGATVWVLATVDTFGQITSVVTPTVTTTTLPPAQRPLARDKNFRRLTRTHTEVFFARPEVFSSFPLFYSLLTPASTLALTWDAAGTSGTFTLGNTQSRLPTPIDLPFIPAAATGASLLYAATIAPSVWLAESGRALRKIDATQADGLRGIGLAMLQKHTGSTDLQSFLSMIRAVSLQLTREVGVVTPFVTGFVRSASDLQAWQAAVRSEQVSGTVRTIDLLGENTRTDITQDVSRTYDEFGGWEITPLSARRDFLLATRDRQFIIGLADRVGQAIQTGGNADSAGGSIDLSWAKDMLNLPNDFLPTFLGSEGGQLYWTVVQKGTDRVFSWQLQ